MKSHHAALIKTGALFVILAGSAILCWKLLVTEEQLKSGLQYIQSFGTWSVLVFALMMVVLVSLSFPSSVFNLTAGVLFSFAEALIVASLAGLCAALVTFTISRFFMHSFISEKIKATDSGAKTLALIEQDSAKIILLLRLNPFIPAVVKNYGLGVTDVRYREYVPFTWLGQLPLCVTYVYFGWIGGQALLSDDAQVDTIHWILAGLGVAVSVTTLVASHYYFRKKYQTMEVSK